MNKGLRNELMTVMGLAAVGAAALRKPKTAFALGLGIGILATLVAQEDKMLRRQSVVITGGSRGLGLSLAKELVQEGALVTLLARDGEELQRARQILLKERPDAQVLLVPCDLTKAEDIKKAFEQVVGTWGKIDVLINNAGSMLVGPFDSQTKEDFEKLMELHLYSVMTAVQMALPYFRRRFQGHIVNICSLGGRLAIPHMLSYTASKFALAGYSQGLHTELAKEGLQVTTVFPTLVNTGSPLNASFKGDSEKEFRWFASMDAMPGIAMPADLVARRILKAVREGRSEVMIGRWGRYAWGASMFFPEIAAAKWAFVNRFFLPKGKSTQARKGSESKKLFESSLGRGFLRDQAREAEQRFNQQAPTASANS